MASANPTVSTAFITQYQADVHHAFQFAGSLFMNAVTLVRGVTGSTVRFPVLGSIEANQKARHADVVPLNPAHSNVTSTMEDWYAPIYSDSLDELKANIDYRRIYAKAGAMAVGRRADLVLTDALQSATNIEVVGTTGLTLAKIRSATETLDTNSVPNDGHRWAFIGAHQWQELLNIDEFARAEFIGDGQDLPFKTGVRIKRWYGYNWIMHPNLPLQDSGANRDCYFFHQDAIGLGVHEDIKVEVNYIPEKVAWLVNHAMSMGAAIIEQAGLVEVVCDDNATIV